MNRICTIIILAAAIGMLATPNRGVAQFATPTEGFNNNGTRAAQFLKMAVGGRASAMGESFAAVASDASALFWNPGGIGNLKNFEVHLTHTEYLLDITFDYAGMVVPFGEGNLGFSAAVLGMDEEPVTTLADPDGELGTTWSANSFAIGLTYSRALTDRFAVGITGKYISESIFNSSANTLAIDIGSLYDTGISGIKIGMAMTNFGGKMSLSGRDFSVREVDVDPLLEGNFTPSGELRRDAWPLPLNFRIGLSYDLFRNESSGLTLASDFNHPTDADERINLGAEYAFSGRLFLRGGYKFNYDEESFTAGGGILLDVANRSLVIDYAYRDFGILGSPHMISVGFKM